MMFERDLKTLFRFIAAREVEPHVWGRRANDCGGYALDAVEAVTGRRLFAGHEWTTKRGAMRIVRRFGSFAGIVDRELPRISPARALRADVAGVADEMLGVRLMIVEGDTLVGPGPRGNRRMPRSAMIAAWSVTGIVG